MLRIPKMVLALGLCAMAVTACNSDDTAGSSATPVRATSSPRPVASLTPLPATATGSACGAGANLAPVFCADTSAMERAVVVDIVDGDTLDVMLGGVEQRVRVFGIDTPERGDLCFRESSDLLGALAGDEIRMQTDVRKVDSNGRLLRYVYRPDGASIDALMIAAGMAHAWTRDGALRDELVALETEARNARTGCLWE
jgi:endonuclease YncB( thermonuclease family)